MVWWGRVERGGGGLWVSIEVITECARMDGFGLRIESPSHTTDPTVMFEFTCKVCLSHLIQLGVNDVIYVDARTA